MREPEEVGAGMGPGSPRPRGRATAGEEWTRGPWSLAVFGSLIALAAVIRIGVIFNRVIDPDESQHLHGAWLVGQGQVPYRDFWEHHMPLFYYIAAPLTAWFADRPAVYLAGRALIVGASCRSVPRDRRTNAANRDPGVDNEVRLA